MAVKNRELFASVEAGAGRITALCFDVRLPLSVALALENSSGDCPPAEGRELLGQP